MRLAITEAQAGLDVSGPEEEARHRGHPLKMLPDRWPCSDADDADDGAFYAFLC